MALQALLAVYNGQYSNGSFLQVLPVEEIQFENTQFGGCGRGHFVIGSAAYESATAGNLIAPNRVDCYKLFDTTTQSNVAGNSVLVVANPARFKIGQRIAIYDGLHYEFFLISSISGNNITINGTLTNAYQLGSSVLRMVYRGRISYRERMTATDNKAVIETEGYFTELATVDTPTFQIIGKEAGWVIYNLIQQYASSMDFVINASNFVMTTDTTNGTVNGTGTNMPYTATAQSGTVLSVLMEAITVANGNPSKTVYTLWADELNVLHFGVVPTTTPTVLLTLKDPVDTAANYFYTQDHLVHDQDTTQLFNVLKLTGGTDPNTKLPVVATMVDQTSVNQYSQRTTSLSNPSLTDLNSLKAWGQAKLNQMAYPIQQMKTTLDCIGGFATAQDYVQITGFTDSTTQTFSPLSVITNWKASDFDLWTQSIQGSELYPDVNRLVREIVAEHYVASKFLERPTDASDRFVQYGCVGSYSGGTFSMTAGVLVANIISGGSTVQQQFAVSAASSTPSSDGSYTIALLYRNTNGTQYSTPTLVTFSGYTAANYTGTGAPITDYQTVPLYSYTRLGGIIVGYTDRRNVAGIGTNHFQSNPNTSTAPALTAGLGAVTYAQVQSPNYDVNIASIQLTTGNPIWLQGYNLYAQIHGSSAPAQTDTPLYTLTPTQASGVLNNVKFPQLTAGTSYDLYLAFLDQAGNVSIPLYLYTTAANPTGTMPSAVTISTSANGAITYSGVGGTSFQASVPFNLTITDATGNQAKWLNTINILAKRVTAGSSNDGDTNPANYEASFPLPASRWKGNPTAITALIPLGASSQAYQIAAQVVDQQGNTSLASPFVVTTPQSISAPAVIAGIDNSNLVADSDMTYTNGTASASVFGSSSYFSYYGLNSSKFGVLLPGSGDAAGSNILAVSTGTSTLANIAAYSEPINITPGLTYCATVTWATTNVVSGQFQLGMVSVADKTANSANPATQYGSVTLKLNNTGANSGTTSVTYAVPSSGAPAQMVLCMWALNVKANFYWAKPQIEIGTTYSGYKKGPAALQTGNTAHSAQSTATQAVIDAAGTANPTTLNPAYGSAPHGAMSSGVRTAIDSIGGVDPTKLQPTYGQAPHGAMSSAVTGVIDSSATIDVGHARTSTYLPFANTDQGIQKVTAGNLIGATIDSTTGRYVLPSVDYGCPTQQTYNLGVGVNALHTLEATFQRTATGADVGFQLFSDYASSSWSNGYLVQYGGGEGNVLRIYAKSGGAYVFLLASTTLTVDLLPHTMKVVVSQPTAGTIAISAYIDGVLAATTTTSTYVFTSGRHALSNRDNGGNTYVDPNSFSITVGTDALEEAHSTLQNRNGIAYGLGGAPPYVDATNTLQMPSAIRVTRPDGSATVLNSGVSVALPSTSGQVFIAWNVAGTSTIIAIARTATGSAGTGYSSTLASTAYEPIGAFYPGTTPYTFTFYGGSSNIDSAAYNTITDNANGTGYLNVDRSHPTKIMPYVNLHGAVTRNINSSGQNTATDFVGTVEADPTSSNAGYWVSTGRTYFWFKGASANVNVGPEVYEWTGTATGATDFGFVVNASGGGATGQTDAIPVSGYLVYIDHTGYLRIYKSTASAWSQVSVSAYSPTYTYAQYAYPCHLKIVVQVGASGGVQITAQFNSAAPVTYLDSSGALPNGSVALYNGGGTVLTHDFVNKHSLVDAQAITSGANVEPITGTYIAGVDFTKPHISKTHDYIGAGSAYVGMPLAAAQGTNTIDNPNFLTPQGAGETTGTTLSRWAVVENDSSMFSYIPNGNSLVIRGANGFVMPSGGTYYSYIANGPGNSSAVVAPFTFPTVPGEIYNIGLSSTSNIIVDNANTNIQFLSWIEVAWYGATNNYLSASGGGVQIAQFSSGQTFWNLPPQQVTAPANACYGLFRIIYRILNNTGATATLNGGRLDFNIFGPYCRKVSDLANETAGNLQLTKSDQVLQNRTAIHGGFEGAPAYMNGYTLTFPSTLDIFRPDGSYSYIGAGSSVVCSGNTGYGFVFLQWAQNGAGSLVYVPRPSLSSAYTGSTAYELIGQTTGAYVFNSPYAANSSVMNAAQNTITSNYDGTGYLNVDRAHPSKVLPRISTHTSITNVIDAAGTVDVSVARNNLTWARLDTGTRAGVGSNGSMLGSSFAVGTTAANTATTTTTFTVPSATSSTWTVICQWTVQINGMNNFGVSNISTGFISASAGLTGQNYTSGSYGGSVRSANNSAADFSTQYSNTSGNPSDMAWFGMNSALTTIMYGTAASGGSITFTFNNSAITSSISTGVWTIQAFRTS